MHVHVYNFTEIYIIDKKNISISYAYTRYTLRTVLRFQLYLNSSYIILVKLGKCTSVSLCLHVYNNGI